MEELRLYSFQNMYFSGIHAGIQTAHTIAEISLQTEEKNSYKEWAYKHKTIVILNGGMEKDLWDLYEFLDTNDNPFMWDYFQESKEAANEALTNISIILPERIFNFKKNMPNRYKNRWYSFFFKIYTPEFIEYIKSFTKFERELGERVSKCRLMN